MGSRSHVTSRLLQILLLLAVGAVVLAPGLCFADFQSSLEGVKNKVTYVILPTLSVIGLAFAAVSFFTGNPQAKQHIIYAILGCLFGFGAESIMNLIRDTVR